MNYRERFREILEFLRPYQTIWQNEIMLQYPTPFLGYPEHWLSDLLRFNDREDLVRLERKQVEGLIQDPSLKVYYERRKALIDVPWAPDAPPMPETNSTWLFMIPKKQYEIRKLAPLINDLYRRKSVEKIIDIGGGIGLLAQTLANQYGHRVCSVDLDPKMQETGRERNRKNATDPANLVEYRNVKVEVGDSEFSRLLDPQMMTVGLHTCGPLAVAQLEASARRKTSVIVNFGCCYHKMEDGDGAQNVSAFARELGPLHFSQFALTLASRAHLKLPDKDYDFKQKVKHFRYAIHFLLYDHYGIRKNLTLGNSHRSLYEGSFSAYALEQLTRVGIEAKHTPAELDAFYDSPELQVLIRKMLAGGTIRDSFGRLLELYILLDRAIYLEENGYQVDLVQCFDEVTSPRNLGILALR